MSESESETRPVVVNPSDGWASADTGRFYGEWLKFTEGKWFTGEEQKPVPEGLNLIVTGVSVEWKCWGKKGEGVIDRKDASFRREDLGRHDETQWEISFGKPRDPWALTWRADLIDPTTLDEFRYEASNAGGTACIEELVVRVNKARTLDPRARPIVILSNKVMRTDYGQRLRPCLKVVGWQPPIKGGGNQGAPSLPSPSNDMSDEIPF
jgi:hypothetical protein